MSVFHNSRINPRLLNVPVVSPRPNRDSRWTSFSTKCGLGPLNPIPAEVDSKIESPFLSRKCHEPSTRFHRSSAVVFFNRTEVLVRSISELIGGQSDLMTAHDRFARSVLPFRMRIRKRSG